MHFCGVKPINTIVMQIPEYIEGIPTEKKRVRERFELIKSYYENLWKDLQRVTGSNYIHNKFLNADVYIVKNESDKNMILLYYQFESEQIDYLNFTVKLTIGVTASQKHIQYSVNKVEVAK